MQVPIENLVIDGDTKSGQMQADGKLPPFALFCPELQHNVGGPYAKRKHAEAALKLIKKGKMIPYTDEANIIWTYKGKPSKWYRLQ